MSYGEEEELFFKTSNMTLQVEQLKDFLIHESRGLLKTSGRGLYQTEEVLRNWL